MGAMGRPKQFAEQGATPEMARRITEITTIQPLRDGDLRGLITEGLTPLGVLSGRRIIDGSEKKAAIDFEENYRKRWANAAGTCGSVEKIDRGFKPVGSPTDRTCEIARRYSDALNLVGAYEAMRDLLIYETPSAVIVQIVALGIRRLPPHHDGSENELRTSCGRDVPLDIDRRIRAIRSALRAISDAT